MNVKTRIQLEHVKGGPAAPYNGDRSLKVTLVVDMTAAMRGEATVGALNAAFEGARKVAVESIRFSGSA